MKDFRALALLALCWAALASTRSSWLPEAEAAGAVNYWVQAVYVQGPNQELAPRATSYPLTVAGVFLGTNVDTGGIERFEIQIQILFADTPAQILTKVIDAVQAEAIRRGYTVNRNAGLIPSFQRGS